jgi:DNA-binding transcriptional regulator YiaG
MALRRNFFQGDQMIWNKQTVKALRAHAKLTQEQLARDMEFSLSAVQGWEHGTPPGRQAQRELDRQWEIHGEPRLDTSGQSE